MHREELEELHYITPIANLGSIMKHGILSNTLAAKLSPQPESIAMPEVQERRKHVIPGGRRRLHDYVNLYFNARNPMLYSRLSDHTRICILRITPQILDVEGTIVTDRNAASGQAKFRPAPEGLSIVDHDRVFADWWNHDDPIDKLRHKAEMCAEVLVLNRIAPNHILGAYTSGPESSQAVQTHDPQFPVTINKHRFFM